MNWTDIIIALGSIVASIFALKKMFFDGIYEQFKKMDERFDKLEKEMKEGFKEVKDAIHILDKRVTRIEDRLEFSNKVVYIQHEERKEN